MLDALGAELHQAGEFLAQGDWANLRGQGYLQAALLLQWRTGVKENRMAVMTIQGLALPLTYFPFRVRGILSSLEYKEEEVTRTSPQ